MCKVSGELDRLSSHGQGLSVGLRVEAHHAHAHLYRGHQDVGQLVGERSASEQLRGDREVVLAAVAQNGNALTKA